MDESRHENNKPKRNVSYEKSCKISFIFGCVLGVFALAGNVYASYSIIHSIITGTDSLIGAVVLGMAQLCLGVFSVFVSLAAIAFTYNGIKLYKVATIIVLTLLTAGLLCVAGIVIYVFFI